jgi:peptide/nickel transport system permease protein
VRFASPLLQALAVVLAASAVTFAVQTAIPGNPAADFIGPSPGLSPQQRAAAVHEEALKLGIDKPLPLRYIVWLGHAIRGNFGTDVNDQNVRSTVTGRLGSSLEIVVLSALVSVPIAVLLAVAVVRRRHGWLWRVWNGIAVAGLVLPPFWLALLLVLVFAVWQHWLPASGYVSFAANPAQHIERLILPTATLAAFQVAVYYRYLQQGLREALESAYVRTARAKGLSERRIMYRHALPNALLPAITILGIQLGTVLGVMVVVEQIFDWPGIGSLLVSSVQNGSYNEVTFIVLVVAVAYVVISALVDVCYRLIDPRIRRA